MSIKDSVLVLISFGSVLVSALDTGLCNYYVVRAMLNWVYNCLFNIGMTEVSKKLNLNNIKQRFVFPN